MVTCEKTIYEALPAGTYPAQLVAAEEADGQYGPQVKLTFEITSGELAGKKLLAWASLRYSEKTKLYGWTRAILGHAPEWFDSDDLLHKPCRIVVSEKLGDGGDVIHNKVDNVLPARQPVAARSAAKAVRAPVEEPPPDDAGDDDLF